MKIICLTDNYNQNQKEESDQKSNPQFYIKYKNALLTNNQPFYYDNNTYKDISQSMELVVKICQKGSNIKKEEARNYYDQMALGFDLVDRSMLKTLQKNGQPWEIATAFDNSAIVGDFIPIQQVERKLKNINFELKVNGKKISQNNSSDMIHSIDEQIEYVSKFLTLEEGDMLFTGSSYTESIQLGNSYEGFLNNEKLVQCEIKSLKDQQQDLKLEELENKRTPSVLDSFLFGQLQVPSQQTIPNAQPSPQIFNKKIIVKTPQKYNKIVPQPEPVAENDQLKPETLDVIKTRLQELISHKNCGYDFIRLSYNDAAKFKSDEEPKGCPNAALRLKRDANDTADEAEGQEDNKMVTLSDCEEAYEENKGLSKVVELLSDISEQFCPESISHADLWALAANVSIEQMGGPRVPMRFGRRDAQTAEESLMGLEDRLPQGDENVETLKKLYSLKGLNDREMVAICGRNTVAVQNYEDVGYEGRVTQSPHQFNNVYFTNLVTLEYKQIMSKGFRLQYWNEEHDCNITPSEQSLIYDKNVFNIVTEYHLDQNVFFKDFASAWQKLQELGTQDLYTVDDYDASKEVKQGKKYIYDENYDVNKKVQKTQEKKDFFKKQTLLPYQERELKEEEREEAEQQAKK